jgi:hypothetical protein
VFTLSQTIILMNNDKICYLHPLWKYSFHLWSQSLMFARQAPYHPTPDLLCLLFLSQCLAFLLRLTRILSLLLYFPCKMDDRYKPSCTDIGWDWFSLTCQLCWSLTLIFLISTLQVDGFTGWNHYAQQDGLLKVCQQALRVYK